MSKLQEIFMEEAAELLPELEEAFLELEDDNSNMDIVARIFRAMHTIKGSGSMCDFPNLANFTHELETAFDRVRKGEIAVSGNLIQIGLDSHSYISRMIEAADVLNPTLREQGNEILTRLRVYSPNDTENSSQLVATEEVKASAEDPDEDVYYRIRFVPEQALLTYGINPLNILIKLSELGEIKTVAYTDKIPPLADLDETACYISWEIILSTEHPRDEIEDIFSLVEEDSDIQIELISYEDDFDEEYSKLGDILIARGDLAPGDLNALFGRRALVGELVVESGLVSQEKVDSALLEQEVIRETREQRKQTVTNDNIRVSSSRLDKQMDLVGELVIALASFDRMAKEREDSELITMSEDLDQLITGIRDNVLGIRMLPIGSTFSKFRRLVRDLSSEQGKKIELVTIGADTELDKSVIDQLGDPLVHMIRNSLDHGIEKPADRVAEGKPEIGTITLTARHAQGQVIIEIRDDGKGIDPEIIWNKAVEKGLASADSRPSDKDILQYIFAAGFSTASSITNISGRGVGMDVVKRAVEDLRGTIDIESAIGEGSVLTLRLPLTLAIIEGLLVVVNEEALVVPLSVVEECVETNQSELLSSVGGQLLRVRGDLIPCLPLRNWVGQTDPMPEDIQIIIVNVDDEKYGLIVDDVIGQQQIVIKNLGSVYSSIKGVSGATILGDGSVALMLDLQQLVQLFLMEETA